MVPHSTEPNIMALTTPAGLGVREIQPNGGPFAGGPVVSLNVTNTSALLLSDLRCRFRHGDDGLVYDFPSVVDAHLADERWSCVAPPFYERQRGASRHRLPLEVSADGGATFSTSGIAFTYFELAEVGVSALTPRGGPHLSLIHI